MFAKTNLYRYQRSRVSSNLKVSFLNSYLSALYCFPGEYEAHDWLFDNMRKKAALEKMSLENPGFDLSGVEITGHYATGGPDTPS